MQETNTMSQKRMPLTERMRGSGHRARSRGGPCLRSTIMTYVVVWSATLFGEIAMAQTKDDIETRNKAVVQASFDD